MKRIAVSRAGARCLLYGLVGFGLRQTFLTNLQAACGQAEQTENRPPKCWFHGAQWEQNGATARPIFVYVKPTADSTLASALERRKG